MALSPKDRRDIKLYLLGLLQPEPLAERVEERVLTEPGFHEELLAAEDELIDQYISRELGGEERAAFERYFLRSPARARKFRFARALDGYVSSAPRPAAGGAARRGVRDLLRAPWGRPALAAAFALLMVGCGVAAWLAYVRSGAAFDEGLADLRAAYRGGRPSEARMAGFGYSRWSVTRDGRAPLADSVTLDRAEVLLRDAAKKHPGPEADHVLGSLYLAKRQYDQAVALFESGLRADERNARLHNDLGVALFEKGMGARTGGGGVDMLALARSSEHFKRAAELDDSFLEARFNLALAYQNMLLTRQAEEAWKDYLRRDPASAWADEARANLKLVEEQGRATSRGGGQAPREFLEAWRAGDEPAAWNVVGRSYTFAGNEVVNGLLDSLLAPTDGAPAAADEARSALSYIARLASERAGDRFVADLLDLYERTPPGGRPLLAEARRHMKAGEALFAAAKNAGAAGEFEAARQAYERAGDVAGAALAESRLAHSYIPLRALAKARAAYGRLYAACEAKQYRWVAASSLYGLAHVAVAGGDYSEAADYSARALDAFKAGGDLYGELQCLIQLSDINQSLNQIGRSLGYLGRGLPLAAEAQPAERWGFLVAVGLNLESLNLYSTALAFQKEALGLALDSRGPLFVSLSYGYVGADYAALKQYAEASESASRAYAVAAGVPDDASARGIMANASLQLGDILRQSGDCARALAAYDRSLGLYAELKDEYFPYTAHKGKLLCLAAGPDDGALGDELKTVLALSEDYRKKITAETQRVSFFDREQDVYDLAIGYEAERVRDPSRAFEYSEESRARSLNDAVESGAQVLKKEYGPDVSTPKAALPLSLAEVRGRMPEGAQILQYAVLEDRLLVWVVTRSGLRQEEVGVGRAALTEKVRAYLAAVRRPPAGDGDGDGGAARLSEELYRTLIAPAERYLDRSKYLCVVPDKVLHYVPFPALLSPGSGRYVLDDYEVGVAPSSTLFAGTSAAAAAKAGAGDEGLLSVGDPSFSASAFPSVPGLPAAAREAKGVSGFYGRRSVLLRDDATERRVRDGLSRSEVAHLALHYVADGGSEMLSGFPLAPEPGGARGPEADGFLQLHELYGLKMPRTRLVVLSACETGIEQEYAGEGAVGVTRPFLAAGVPLVVASLWPVDSDASAALMVSFHRHRTRDRLNAAQALARAQSEMARGPDPRYRHPFYWAAFLAVGGQTSF
ncbi:MAG TPA: CHAT domain-containing tetratricopeptide repeat protein [Pyrinomonadaceae bacterium]|jgi:CHAT domain-containing protein/tetratricopeptide (TPR) repeat protein